MNDRILGVLERSGTKDTLLASLDHDQQFFALTPQLLLYQSNEHTPLRQVTLRDISRIHSDHQGTLRVETPLETAITASLLGFDPGRVQRFFQTVRDTTARAKEQPSSPLPTNPNAAGALGDLGLGTLALGQTASSQTLPPTATPPSSTRPSPNTPNPNTSGADAAAKSFGGATMPPAANLNPNTASPAKPPAAADTAKPTTVSPPPSPVISTPGASGPNITAPRQAGSPPAAPQRPPTTAPTPAPMSAQGSPTPPSNTNETKAASGPRVVKISAPTPASTAPTAPTPTPPPATSPASPPWGNTQAAAGKVGGGVSRSDIPPLSGPSASTPTRPPQTAKAAGVAQGAATQSSSKPSEALPERFALLSDLTRAAQTVGQLSGTLRVLAVVLALGALGMGYFLWQQGEASRITALWTITVGLVAAATLSVLAEVLKLLTAMGQALAGQSQGGGPQR
ncbi:hypothetical protein [Deinococcus sp.]|uniref:hypothetical protein n=1 Tax=Deinococcus sp. TaxID=47478 RepID=UPI003B5BC8FF